MAQFDVYSTAVLVMRKRIINVKVEDNDWTTTLSVS